MVLEYVLWLMLTSAGITLGIVGVCETYATWNDLKHSPRLTRTVALYQLLRASLHLGQFTFFGLAGINSIFGWPGLISTAWFLLIAMMLLVGAQVLERVSVLRETERPSMDNRAEAVARLEESRGHEPD